MIAHRPMAAKNRAPPAPRADSLPAQADQATFLVAATHEASGMPLEQAVDAELKSKGLSDYYAEQAEHETVARRHAQLALIAARRVAEVLSAEKGSPGRKRNGMHACRFSKMERETYYKIAAVPEGVFQSYLANEEWPTRRGVVQIGKKLARSAKKAAQPEGKVPPSVAEARRRLTAFTAWATKAAKGKKVDERRMLLGVIETVCEGIEILGRYGHGVASTTAMVSAGVIRAHELFGDGEGV